MRKRSVAVVGLGNLGRRCAEALSTDPFLALVGVVRRSDQPPVAWLKAPVVEHIRELGVVDVALLCVPPDVVPGAARELLQARIPVVECARLHGEAFVEHKAEMDRVAHLYGVAAVVGAGWDPGLFSVFRSQFALLVPHGHTQSSLHTGASLHHTLAAQGIAGVRQALATELKTLDNTGQRYVYVELEPGTDVAAVERAIRQDPTYLDEQTYVFPVDSIAALEQQNRGVLLERHSARGHADHTSLLLEARFDEARLAAQIMLAAARALPWLRAGAYSLLDVAPGLLWGAQSLATEKQWI